MSELSTGEVSDESLTGETVELEVVAYEYDVRTEQGEEITLVDPYSTASAVREDPRISNVVPLVRAPECATLVGADEQQ